MATAESVSVRLFGETHSSGATAVGVSSWPVWKSLPDSLLHQLDAHRHAQMRHDVQRPAPDPQLTCLASPLPAPQPIPEDLLDPPDRRLGQRAHVVAHRALPAPPALSPDGAQVLIARV